MRSRASRASSSAIFSSTMPAPAAIVSAACVLGAVALGKRRGDAGLRPEARCAFAEARRRDDGDRQRRELERGEQSGKASTDHDDAEVAGAWQPGGGDMYLVMALRLYRRLQV